jgi:hypothetical protein
VSCFAQAPGALHASRLFLGHRLAGGVEAGKLRGGLRISTLASILASQPGSTLEVLRDAPRTATSPPVPVDFMTPGADAATRAEGRAVAREGPEKARAAALMLASAAHNEEAAAAPAAEAAAPLKAAPPGGGVAAKARSAARKCLESELLDASAAAAAPTDDTGGAAGPSHAAAAAVPVKLEAPQPAAPAVAKWAGSAGGGGAAAAAAASAPAPAPAPAAAAPGPAAALAAVPLVPFALGVRSNSTPVDIICLGTLVLQEARARWRHLP